jgi:hypothetical protein
LAHEFARREILILIEALLRRLPRSICRGIDQQ